MENNMVTDQSDDAQNKRQKLSINSSDDAKNFLSTVLGTAADSLQVPDGAKVRSIEDFFSAAPPSPGSSWVGYIPCLYMKIIKQALSDRKTREQVLQSKVIVFYGFARREHDVQKGISNPIRCNIHSNPSDSPRQDKISLVLGPSGSGKTTYCVKEHGKSAVNCDFRVYMYAADLGKGDRKANLREIVLVEIAKALSVDTNTTEASEKLSMTLYAIIDEAGCDEFFGEEKNLLDLKGAINDIATDVQLVVSGTGLDLLTSNSGSSGEGLSKIRMLPWGLQDFKLLANRDTISKLVTKHEVYTNMTTNARAAAYLLVWLRKTATWGNDDDNVPFVVRAVAYDYISGNSLKDADGATRRQVVRAVLLVLKASKCDSALLPAFDLAFTPDVKRKAQSLVDIHVQKVGKVMKLQQGHHYNVSVTPAITIVLAALLGTTAFMQTNWSGFETVVALNELFKLVREAEDELLHDDFRILQLDKPYDARKNRSKLEVPEMTSSMVLINGSKASYADVIAPFRLIQAKHSESYTPTTLYIGDELKKMGLLSTSSTAQKVFAAGQYRIWEASEAALRSNQSTASDGQSNTETAPHRGLYPASTLVSKQGKTKPTCQIYEMHDVSDGKEDWYTQGTLFKYDRSDMTNPVTVIFVTNGSAFRISASSENGLPSKDFNENEDNLFVSHGSKAVFGELKKLLVEGVVVQLAFASSATQ